MNKFTRIFSYVLVILVLLTQTQFIAYGKIIEPDLADSTRYFVNENFKIMPKTEPVIMTTNISEPNKLEDFPGWTFSAKEENDTSFSVENGYLNLTKVAPSINEYGQLLSVKRSLSPANTEVAQWSGAYTLDLSLSTTASIDHFYFRVYSSKNKLLIEGYLNRSGNNLTINGADGKGELVASSLDLYADYPIKLKIDTRQNGFYLNDDTTLRKFTNNIVGENLSYISFTTRKRTTSGGSWKIKNVRFTDNGSDFSNLADDNVIFNDDFSQITKTISGENSTISTVPNWKFKSLINQGNESKFQVTVGKGMIFTNNSPQNSPEIWAVQGNRTFDTNNISNYNIDFVVRSPDVGLMTFEILGNDIDKTPIISGEMNANTNTLTVGGYAKSGVNFAIGEKISISVNGYDDTYSVNGEGCYNLPRKHSVPGGIDYKISSTSRQWAIEDLKFYGDNSEAIKVVDAQFYGSPLPNTKALKWVQNGEKYENLTGVIKVKNMSTKPVDACVILAQYSKNDFVKLNNSQKITIEPLATKDISVTAKNVDFAVDNSVKLMFWSDMDSITPVHQVKSLQTSDPAADLQIVKKRMQQGIFSTTVNPKPLMDDIDANGMFKSIGTTTAEYQAKATQSSGYAIIEVLKNTKTLVQAYTSAGNAYYHDLELKGKIDLVLTNWASNFLTSSERAENPNLNGTNGGTRFGYMCPDNWWHNDINVPNFITDILIFGYVPDDNVMTTGISPSASIKVSKKLYEIANYAMKSATQEKGGANMTDQLKSILKIAVSTNDTATLGGVVQDLLEQEFAVLSDSGTEGTMADGSFQMHRNGNSPCLIQNGSYGTVFIGGVNYILNYLKDTCFILSDLAINNYANFIIDGQQYFFKNNSFDYAVAGRSVAGYDELNGRVRTSVSSAIDTLLQFNVERKDELIAIKENRLSGNDNTNLARHFWESDITVIQKPNFYASFRGAAHALKSEAISGLNTKGYYLASGATTIMTDGTDYENIAGSWNWNQIPGTTTAQGTNLIPGGYNSSFSVNGSAFVGGVADGSNGVNANDLVETRNADASLTAKKSYFAFSDGFVGLGSDITSLGNKQIVTNINQTLSMGDIVYSDGTPKTLSLNGANVASPKWVINKGVGYVPTSNSILSNKIVAPDWASIGGGNVTTDNNVMNLIIDHGVKSSGQTYEYRVISNATNDNIMQKAGKMKTVENSVNKASVWSETDNALGVVFWTADTLNVGTNITGLLTPITVTVDKPCIIMLTKNGSGFDICLSEPTQNLTGGINVTVNNVTQNIVLPTGLMAGSTVRSTYN